MEAFIAGAWRSIGRGEVLVGGQWRRVTRAESYVDGQWRQTAVFVPPLSVSAPDAYGPPGPGNTPVNNTSYAVTATPVGGLAPYTYAWTILSGGATILTPNSATTQFRQILPASSIRYSTARVTVTDAAGTVATDDIAITLENGGV